MLLFGGMGVPQEQRRGCNIASRSFYQGHTEAQNTLGVMYLLGAGVTASCSTAAELFRKSAEQGDTWAMAKLGRMCEEGQGVPKDSA